MESFLLGIVFLVLKMESLPPASPCFVHLKETEAQGGMGLGLGGAACISLYLPADSRKSMEMRVSSSHMGVSTVGQDGALKGIWVEAMTPVTLR